MKLKGKILSILLIIIMMVFHLFSNVYAHSVDLDPDSLISMPMMIFGGSGTITIKSSVTDYELYFQAVQVEKTVFSQMENIKTEGDVKLKSLKEEYTALKTELDNLKETYNTALSAYTEGLKNTALSDEEKETLKTAYETAKTNYENKGTEYNSKISEYNSKVNEINSKIKELTPMYIESNWTKTTDNKISVDTTKFSGEQPYAVWAKLITSSGTYYDETIYTMTGTKAAEIDVTGVSLDKTTLSLVQDSSYTLTAAITPSDATNKKVIWESDDEDIATVVNGKVTAKSVGTTTITVSTDDGDYTATCKVDVTKKSIQSNESEKIDSTESKVQDKTDDTIAPNKLPNTGVSKMVVLIIVVIGITSIVLFKRYRFYNI